MESRRLQTKMEVKIKKLTETAHIPTKGTALSAGYDLYADHEHKLIIAPGTTHKIHIGIAMEIPHGYFGAIFARSGLAVKRGGSLANAVAVIDEDYRGEIIVPIHNISKDYLYIEPYERIAQIILLPYLNVDFTEVSELSETERAEGGFGSTGVK